MELGQHHPPDEGNPIRKYLSGLDEGVAGIEFEAFSCDLGLAKFNIIPHSTGCTSQIRHPYTLEAWTILQEIEYKMINGIKCSMKRYSTSSGCGFWGHSWAVSAPRFAVPVPMEIEECQRILRTGSVTRNGKVHKIH